MQALIPVTERGIRIGQAHHNAKLTDAQVRTVYELRDVGGWTYQEIAEHFGVSKSCIAGLIQGRRRSSIADRYVLREIKPKGSHGHCA